MLKIYHLPFFRSVRVVWLMEELGEPYEVERPAFPLEPEFKARTGVLAIPTIVDGDIVMGESIAILQYLTGRRIAKSLEMGLTVGPNPDPEAYAEHLSWLHFGEASLMVHSAMLSRIRRLGPESEKTGYAATALETVLTSRLAALERQLEDGRPFLTGEAFTIADISVGYSLGYARLREQDGLFGPRTRDYLERVAARPGYGVANAP
jgi:glutathione S-transferase/3-isopropylmalate dehydratase